TKANIAPGEKLSVIFGKLMKWFADFGTAAWMNTGTTSSTVALGNHTHTAAAVGAVPTTRKVNGKALSADVTLTAPDVGARAEDWLPTLTQVGGVRPNLLDNAHRLINQMGITTRSTSGYMPDRWFCYLSPNSVGHFDLLSDGNLRFTKTSGDYMVVSQRFERTFWNKLIGRFVTVSVLVGADLLTASFTVAASGYQAASLLGGIYNIGIDTLAEYGYVQLVLFANVTTPTIFPMKLELGEGQTLARKDANGNWVLIDPPPDPQQELAKCQRYLQHLHRYCFFIGAALDANTIDFLVPLPVPMRVSPSILNAGGITINGISGFIVTPAVTYNNDSYVRCRAVKANHGVAFATSIFASVDADNVLLSAEL
ncbi:MAG: hypothetical protein VB122_05060, partial [Erysipelotrichales bacterium]|nr:hypothetical protein [Erysipelotrichales bacterium]